LTGENILSTREGNAADLVKKMHEEMLDVRGHKLRIRKQGDGPPVLYLHGAGGANWSPLHDELSAHSCVIAPEHPGFGRSDIPDWMMGMSDLAYFYLDVLDAFGYAQVHLVGHSIGGWLAAEVAIRNTTRIKSLTLMAPAGISSPDEPFQDIFLWTPEESAANNYYDQTIAQARLAAPVDMDVFLQNRAGAARLAWHPRLENPQLARWLHRIDVPTLLVWGREDKVIPYACRAAYQDGIAQAELATIERCGHALHTEAADQVSARLNAFFRSVAR
jgi:pimeloyl-ACP methyl ester carboxylesterase